MKDICLAVATESLGHVLINGVFTVWADVSGTIGTIASVAFFANKRWGARLAVTRRDL